MLRSILVGLDGSRQAETALTFAIHWAQRFDAGLVGIGIVDDPGIRNSEGMLLAEGYPRSLYKPLVEESRRQVERTLQAFGQRCQAAGVSHRALEVTGTPYVQILDEARGHDLIILGQSTHFEYGWGDEDDETLDQVIKQSPRPVVVVPRQMPAIESRAPVLISYDGSVSASRALASFVQNGLTALGPVYLLGIDPDGEVAERRIQKAVDFLQVHQIHVHPHPVATRTSPAQVILERVKDWNVGLVVMGAYDQPPLKEFFLGSATRTVLRESIAPILLSH